MPCAFTPRPRGARESARPKSELRGPVEMSDPGRARERKTLKTATPNCRMALMKLNQWAVRSPTPVEAVMVEYKVLNGPPIEGVRSVYFLGPTNNRPLWKWIYFLLSVFSLADLPSHA